MNKILAGTVTAGLLAAGGTITADQLQNPYTTVGSKLEISTVSTIPQAGMDKVSVDTTQPKITLSKFNGELNMGVTYQGMAPNTTGARPFLSKNVEWSDGNQTMQVVPIEASSTMEDGGYAINKRGRVERHPLWQETGLKAPTKDCTDTDCMLGTVRENRPDKIVGSYAVYYTDHANHAEGQVNYATGKAYHIFRPKVIDSNGETTWAVLSYDKSGILSVTVPQYFLNTAIYPITIDPTFGYTTHGGSNGFIQNTQFYLTNIGYTGAAGTTVSETVYGNSSNPGSGNIQAAIYSGSPASTINKVDNTGSIVIGTSDAEYTGNLTGATISAISYYLPLQTDTTNVNIHNDSNAGSNYYTKTNTYGTWSASYSSLTQQSFALQWSVYVTYNAPAAAPTPAKDYITGAKGYIKGARGYVK